MLIRFWCDSEITFSRGLYFHVVTVLYFSIINVLCGAGGDASFAPQTNLVAHAIIVWHVKDHKYSLFYSMGLEFGLQKFHAWKNHGN